MFFGSSHFQAFEEKNLQKAFVFIAESSTCLDSA